MKQSERKTKVYEKSGYYVKPNTPEIKLSGKYLISAGFPAGTPLTVKVFKKTILITADE